MHSHRLGTMAFLVSDIIDQNTDTSTRTLPHPFSRNVPFAMAKQPKCEPNVGNKLLDLPTEVRHRIFEYLFCANPGQLWMTSHYKTPSLGIVTTPEPIFQTQVFRLCTKMYRDAIMFAYSANEIMIRDDFSAFWGLGAAALASIRHLTVMQVAWRAETKVEDRVWTIIQQYCINIARLQVALHDETLLPVIPYLKLLPSSQKLYLDLSVWDRHFTFDPIMREHARAKRLIDEGHSTGEYTPQFCPPRQRVMRLPTNARELILSADLTEGSIRALDEYIASQDRPFLLKSPASATSHQFQSVPGRSHRYLYQLDLP